MRFRHPPRKREPEAEPAGKARRAFESVPWVRQAVVRLAEIDAADCPYFAIVLVHGKGRHLDAAE